MLCGLVVLIASGYATVDRLAADKHPVRDRYLFGQRAVAAHVGYASPGRATAFSFSSPRTGTVTAIRLYVDTRTRARVLIAGLYAAHDSHPSRVLASRALHRPHRGRWITVSIRATRVSAGRTYWLAVLAKGGRLYFRDQGTGKCSTPSAHRRKLASLPKVWRDGRRDTCGLSAYFLGTLSRPSSGASPPPSSSAPSPAPLVPGINCAGARGSGAVSQSSLDACGFPSMDTTGPLKGTSLTGSPGFTASTPGAVYSSLRVNGGISITASNVTIQNSDITDVNSDNSAINVAAGATGVKLLNDSIHGTNAVQSGSLAFAVSYFGSSIDGVTIDHTNFYNGDRILAGYGTVTNSYCFGGAHFSTSGGDMEHDECIYTDGGAPGIRAIHDTLINANPDQTAAIFVDNPDFGGGGVLGTVDVEDSLLAGGDYCLYGGGGSSTPHVGPVTIKNNRFSRIYWPDCGQYGPQAHFTAPVTTWSGNVWDDTNKPVGP